MEQAIDIGNQTLETPAPEKKGWSWFSMPEDKSFLKSGFIKGVVIAALALVVGFALVTGGHGAGASVLGPLSQFQVDGSIITTFENGFGHGIGIALDFLIKSPIAWATMAVGGVMGIGYDYSVALSKEASAPDSEAHKKIIELTKELEFQKCLNTPLVGAPDKTADKTPDAPKTAKEAEDYFYRTGQLIEDKDFRASELKRRVDIGNNDHRNAL